MTEEPVQVGFFRIDAQMDTPGCARAQVLHKGVSSVHTYISGLSDFVLSKLVFVLFCM
jgi:hypothetical protein